MAEAEQSEDVLRLHPHPVHFAGAVGFAAFVGLVVVLLIKHNDLPRSVDWQILACGVLVAIGGFVGPVVRWTRARFELSAEHLRWTLGVVRPDRLDAPLADLRDLELEQGLLGRAFGYGTVRLVDADGRERVFAPLGHVEALKQAVARRAGSSRARARR
jgi:membrane protein YdbS with pleckstrin-like domain